MHQPDPDYEGFGWIKVPRYRVSPDKSWEERYRDLEAHHVQETEFLISEVRRLAAELKAVRERGVEGRRRSEGGTPPSLRR